MADNLNLLRRRSGVFATLAVFFVLLIGSSAFSFAADNGKADEQNLVTWENRFKEILENSDRRGRSPAENKILRDEIESIIHKASALREEARVKERQVQSLLDQIGPKPDGEGAGQEAPSIKEKRDQLSSELAGHQSHFKQAGLIFSRGEQILAAFGRQSREQLRRTLGERGVTPLSLETWESGGRELISLLQNAFIEAPVQWWKTSAAVPEKRKSLARIIIFALLVALAAFPLRRWLLTHWGRTDHETEPSYARRLLAGLVMGVARGLIPVFFILAIRLLIIDEGIFEERLLIVAKAITESLAIYFFAYALISAALAPRRLQWRIVDFDEKIARLFVSRLNYTLIVFVVFDGLAKSISLDTSSVELESIYAFAFTIVLTPALFSLTRNMIWEPTGETRTEEKPEARESMSIASHASGARLRALLAAILFFLPLFGILGYSNLSIYLSRAFVLTGIILGSLWLARTMVHEAISRLVDPSHKIGRELIRVLAIKNEGSTHFVFWAGALIDLSLFSLTVVLMLPVWGLGADETTTWIARVFRGVQVGSYTFSLSDFLFGGALFFLIIILTRLLQRALAQHVLPNISRDKGVTDAIKTGVGYIGVIIAALVGISVIGLDLTNLAIIAGALSVGLGFGLQNVVNNFVSGLILLAERPIKPGDWVVIGAHEGNVKKVNVRSTEIETFQKASVIIPNADLIANPVMNWTHKNLSGRAEVAVGVAYGSDTELVEKILLDCAAQHMDVVADPEPLVLFMNFGESSLDFELRAYLKNVEKRLSTSSDLRKAIDKAFRENGIEIPFPQRVLHHLENARSRPKKTKETGSPVTAKKEPRK